MTDLQGLLVSIVAAPVLVGLLYLYLWWKYPPDN